MGWPFLRLNNSPNYKSRDYLTPTNLDPDNTIKSTDPPNNVVETKHGVEDVVEYIIRNQRLEDSD